MNNGGEAAAQMVREALQFSEVAIKLTALGFKNSLAIALAYAKENPKVRGKTSLDRLLREGKEMKIIPLQTKEYLSLFNDARTIQRTKAGGRVAAVSAAVRYLHAPASVGSFADFENMLKLTRLFLADQATK